MVPVVPVVPVVRVSPCIVNGTMVVVLGGSVPRMVLSRNRNPWSLSMRRSSGACVDREAYQCMRPRIHRSRPPQNFRVNVVHDWV